MEFFSYRLRWSRLDNLVREGSRSQAFESSRLWLLADWLFSEQGEKTGGKAKSKVKEYY